MRLLISFLYGFRGIYESLKQVETLCNVSVCFANNKPSNVNEMFNNPAQAAVVCLIAVLFIICIAFSILYFKNDIALKETLRKKNSLIFAGLNRIEYILELNYSNENKLFLYLYKKNENINIGEEKITLCENNHSFDNILDKYVDEENLAEVKSIFDIYNLQQISEKKGINNCEAKIFIDNKSVNCSVYLTPKISDDINETSIYIFIKNIDHKIQHEKERIDTLTAALESAQRFYNTKTDFLSNMSHNIRTPMNAIVGMSSMARMNINNPEKLDSCLNSINESADKLLSLINNVFDMSAIEKGNIEFGYERIDIKVLCSEIYEQFYPIASKKNIDIFLDTNKVKHSIVYTDASKLKQVLYNLVDNAVKYTSEDGCINITLSERISKYDNKYFYNIIVKDNGIGMEKETVEKAFIPFERGKEAKFIEGSGLGLSISKSIIDAMGGIIKIDSAVNSGTTVSLSLCLADGNSQIGYETNKILEGKCVLVISKENENRLILMNLLEELNASSLFFGNENDALMYIINSKNTAKIDYIILNTSNVIDEDISFAKELFDNFKCKCSIIDICEDIRDKSTNVSSDFDNLLYFLSEPINKEKLLKVINESTSSQSEKNQAKMASKSSTGKRALVVDDIEINRIFAQTIVEMKGFEVDVCSNGQEAYDKINNFPDYYYDIVLMDISMPIMDGFTATRLIRESDKDYMINLPIIAMSAYSDKEYVDKAFSSGMNHHLAKPIDINEFSKILNHYIITEQ